MHVDLGEFATLTRPLLDSDPVRHTVALTVITARLRVQHTGDEPPVLLAVHESGALAGAALCTPPRGLITSALPPRCAPAAARVLAEVVPELSEATGPRPEVEAFVQAWLARTGATVREHVAQRLFALDRLSEPATVDGASRCAGDNDVALLARWRAAFADETTGGMRSSGSAEQQTRRSRAAGNAALLWEVGGRAVAWASVSAPVAGMSRVGPVYTPPDDRGRGYGSAVTAAATAWAQRAGARHVVLFTELSNPVSNAIYPRLGYHPVHDALAVTFAPAPSPHAGSGRGSGACGDG